jgi:hypothetical protein
MTADDASAAYHLIVHPEDVATLRLALTAFRDDFGHDERKVLRLAGEVLDAVADDGGTIALSEGGLKVTWSALHTLLDDSRRDERVSRAQLHALLERLPAEADVRSIDIDRLPD